MTPDGALIADRSRKYRLPARINESVARVYLQSMFLREVLR